jgi:hypothetical protein
MGVIAYTRYGHVDPSVTLCRLAARPVPATCLWVDLDPGHQSFFKRACASGDLAVRGFRPWRSVQYLTNAFAAYVVYLSDGLEGEAALSA